MRHEGAAEALLEKSRRHGQGVRLGYPPLRQPAPGQPVRITEIERTADTAPGPRAIEEAELPVVDVQDQRTPSSTAREQPQTEAAGARLRGVDHVAVDQAEQLGHDASEARIAVGPRRPMRDRARGHRAPERVPELRAHHVDLVARGEQAREQLGAPQRVVRQIEAEDRDLHDGGLVNRT